MKQFFGRLNRANTEMSRLLTLSMMIFIFAVPTSYSHIRIFHCLYAKTYSRHQYSIKKNSFNSKLKNGFLNSRIQRSCPRETTTTKQRSEVTLSLLFSCLCNMTQRYRISQSQKTMFTIFFTKLYR